MPRMRWTLDASTKAEYANITKRMRDAGADLSPAEPAAEWIEVRLYPSGSAVRSWAYGTVFALYACLLGIAPKTQIKRFELSSPAWDFDPYILGDPAGASSPRDMYRMLDDSRYHRCELLNQQLGGEGLLRRGDAIEGWVLAECMSAAPVLYGRTEWLPLSLSIVNQFEDVHRVSFRVPVERIQRRIQTRTSRESLFDTQFPKSVDTHEWPTTESFCDGVAEEAGRRNRDES